MGVLNVTPDSFSDGGQFVNADQAVAHARAMAQAGADIIDVGGESARPGAAAISADEEHRRIIPVIKQLRDLLVSVDTTKAVVAEQALAAGARIVNDISALQFDARMVEVVRDAQAGLVLMHMQGTPETMQQEPQYDDVVTEVREFLKERVAFAVHHGIAASRIAVDPGIGFGKTVTHNLALLARLSELQSLRQPILVGTSRKSFIGNVLDRPVEQRLWGTAATVTWAIAHGANIVRVHDVPAMAEVARMCDALRHTRRDGLTK